jgi:hypothetical protein
MLGGDDDEGETLWMTLLTVYDCPLFRESIIRLDEEAGIAGGDRSLVTCNSILCSNIV